MMFLHQMPHTAATQATGFQPSVDLVEGQESYVLRLELPGIDPQALELTLENGELTIKGELPQQTVGGQTAWHLRERTFGPFERSFRFPTDVTGVEAESKHGLLTITVAKAPEAIARRIPISIV